MFGSIKNRVKRSIARERAFEPRFEALSRFLWPWPDARLILFIVVTAILDYVSTYVAIKLSISDRVSEVGLIAKWALQTGGFLKLFFVDVVIIGALLLLAVGARHFYNRLGLPGFARTAFILVLMPYAVTILAVVYNNILVAFLGQYPF